MKRKPLISEWPCSWEEHELVELREGMRMSLRDKLVWLEQATEFANKLQASPKVQQTSPDYGGNPSKPVL
jgi:hypothetical protein